jgi:hypothetical protein
MSELPEALRAELAGLGVDVADEVGLRQALERCVPTYSLVRLNTIASKRWKCHYRLLLGTDYYDAQTAAEAYARGIVATLSTKAASDTV